jgi:hypothetical protein
MPDGRFILMRSGNTAASDAATVVVVQNWLEELKGLIK